MTKLTTSSSSSDSLSSPLSNSERGILYIVATPIGNIEDITFRAIKALQSVSMIYAEDTRHSKRLCEHYEIKTKLLSLHEHNEQTRIEQVANQLLEGQSIALISDAGTPLISDPGYKLVHALRQKGMNISPIPGPSAIVSALSVAGLATDSFSFWGFLPSKSSGRKQKFELLLNHAETLVFYESSHRIQASLKDALHVFGARNAVIARELTKTFETVIADQLTNLVDIVEQDSNQRRGEFVLMIEGSSENAAKSNFDSKQLLQELLKELPPNKAAKIAAKLTNANKQELYKVAMALKSG